jgi:DNA repair photolyase
MDYWEIRKIAAKLIPRRTSLFTRQDLHVMKEKGRKGNYHQYDIGQGKMEKLERLLDKDNINSFVEVSLRAQSCPMPLNIDVYDGLKCPFACKYCFADYFRHSLYTSFFDNGKDVGLRHSDPDKAKEELEKLFAHRGEPVSGENAVVNAIRLDIPMRLGIRFEDFIPLEKVKGISYQLLSFLKDAAYPTMINTKSDLVGADKYVKVLADNEGKAAVHITLISSDEEFLKKMEPGAPTAAARFAAMKRLTDGGVRVVARIEPWMVFINDDKAKVDEYIGKLKEAGVRHVTLDSYSYSAASTGLAENFHSIGYDFDRMFLLSSDSQWLSSFLLGKFIEYFRTQGIECSTFDQGNVPENDDWICCSVGDHFQGGFNWGSGVIAIKYIKSRKGQPTSWSDFVAFVEGKGGFLTSALKDEVKHLWNGSGDAAWPIYWAQGLEVCGSDQGGFLWKYVEGSDFRRDLWEKGGLK